MTISLVGFRRRRDGGSVVLVVVVVVVAVEEGRYCSGEVAVSRPEVDAHLCGGTELTSQFVP